MIEMKKIVGIAVATVVGLQLAATPVFALDEGIGVTVHTNRGDKMEASEQTEVAGSRPGLLRNFFMKGRAAIGSGTLTAINDTTLTVQDKSGTSFTVLTDSKTQFRRRFWGKSSLAEMSVGDTVNVIGKWTNDTHTTIQARLVRDISIQKRNGVFFGVVQSVSASGFVIQTINRGTLTVTLSSSTKLINRKEQTIVQTDIVVGNRVRVKGLWDAKLHTLTEVTQVKDFSLPLQVAETPTPTITLLVTSTPTPTPTP